MASKKTVDDPNAPEREVKRLRRRIWLGIVLVVLYTAGLSYGVYWWARRTGETVQRSEQLAKAQQEMINQLQQQGQTMSADKATVEDLARMMEQSNAQTAKLKEDNKRMRDSLILEVRQYGYVLEATNRKGRFTDLVLAKQVVAKDSVQMTLRLAVPAAAKLADIGKVGYVALNTDTRLKREEVSATTPANGFLVTLPNLKAVDMLQVRYYKRGTGELLHEQYYPL
jgi:hypothetical protein